MFSFQFIPRHGRFGTVLHGGQFRHAPHFHGDFHPFFFTDCAQGARARHRYAIRAGKSYMRLSHTDSPEIGHGASLRSCRLNFLRLRFLRLPLDSSPRRTRTARTTAADRCWLAWLLVRGVGPLRIPDCAILPDYRYSRKVCHSGGQVKLLKKICYENGTSTVRSFLCSWRTSPDDPISRSSDF